MIKNLFSKINIGSGNLLYYPGCLTKFALPEIEQNYIKILDYLNVDYIKISEFYCCGSPVKNAGYKDDFNTLIEKGSSIFSKYNIKRVVTNCPSCAHILSNYYHVDAIHITKFLMSYLEKGFLKNSSKKNITLTYHDSCHLGRKLKIFEEPREIIKTMGYDVVEFSMNREKAICCGAGGGLKNNYPLIANNNAQKKINEAIYFNSKGIITPCPMCYKHFNENNIVGVNSDFKIFELSQLLIKEIDVNDKASQNNSYNEIID